MLASVSFASSGLGHLLGLMGERGQLSFKYYDLENMLANFWVVGQIKDSYSLVIF